MGQESLNESDNSLEGRPSSLSSGYAVVDDLRLAYEVSGEGPPLVFAGSSFTNMEALWDDPEASLFFNRLGRFCTLVHFDMLGVGGSDRIVGGESPSLAAQLLALLDHLELEEAAVLALLQGGAGAVRFAAEHPERLSRLILWNSTARMIFDEDYPIGLDPTAYRQMVDIVVSNWGSEAMAKINVPSRADDSRFMKWYVRYIRGSASPGQVIDDLTRAETQDVRDLLPRVEVPTLVMSRADYASVPSSHGSFMAEMIPNGVFVSIPGADGPMYWEGADEILGEIEGFLTGGSSSGRARPETVTMLFTDIVSSTEQASAMGDAGWSVVLAQHDQIVEKWVGLSSGRVIKHTGDGVFVEFTGVSPALEAARHIREDLDRLSVKVRIGVHTAEVERRAADLEGIGVVIAARIMDAAGAGQILVSETVCSLVLGSSWKFRRVGSRQLKGLDGEWELLELV